MWVLYAFGSAFFAGITAILAKIGVEDTDSNLATAIRTLIILIFSWLVVFGIGSYKAISTVSMKTLIFLILSGLSTGGSWACYFKAIQLGDVNKVTPIDKASTVLTMIFAFIFLREKITMWKILSIIGITIGTYLMVAKKKGEKGKEKDKKKEHEKNSKKKRINMGWMFYAIVGTVFASLTAIFGKVGIEGLESNLGTAIRTIVVLIMAWIIVFATKKQNEIKKIKKKGWVSLSFSGITTGLSWLCYYKALQGGDAGVVQPIDKLSIIVTIIFSYFVLKEKVTKKAFIGLIVIVIGTLLLLI